MVVARRWVLGLFATVVFGCSLIVAPAEDLKGGSLPDAAPSPDAPNASESSPPDAGLDARCQADSSFCDDFEIGDLSPRWRKFENPSTVGVVASDVGVHASGMYVMRVQAPETPATSRADGIAIRSLQPGYPATLSLRFWLYLSNLSAFDESFAAWAYVVPGEVYPDFQIFVNATSGVFSLTLINAQRSYVSHATSVAPVEGKWTCVELDTTLGTTFGHMNLFVNDTSALSVDENTVGAAVDTTIGTFDLQLGLLASAGATAQSLYFDDVIAVLEQDVTVKATPRIGCN